MLKLERSSQSSSLTVRLREREMFFEPRVLKALSIAVFLHCAALLLFQVAPFSFTSSHIFSPVKVQSNHQEQSISLVASTFSQEGEDELAPPSISLIPPLEASSLLQESTLSPTLALKPNAFEKLEEQIWPIWDLPLTFDLEEPRIRLAVSGDLAEHSLIATHPLLNQMQSIHVSASPAYVSYQVQMDEATGEIFWFERLQSSGIKEVDQLTETILSQLRFASKNSFEWVTGNVNFTLLIKQEGSKQ